jgi:hypothetical protein
MAEAKPGIRFSQIHNLDDQSYKVTIFLDNINNDEYRFFITADESEEQESLKREMRAKNKLPQMNGKNIFLFPNFQLPPGTATYMFYLFSGPNLQGKTFDQLIEYCATNECKIMTKSINVMPPPMQPQNNGQATIYGSMFDSDSNGGRRHRSGRRRSSGRSKRSGSKRSGGSRRGSRGGYRIPGNSWNGTPLSGGSRRRRRGGWRGVGVPGNY